jgi:hypothetical protein
MANPDRARSFDWLTDAARALREAELASEEIERILRVCGPHALLVGRQALATCAVYYGIQPVGELSRTVTMDADFIGTKETAQTSRRSLGQPWKLRAQPCLADHVDGRRHDPAAAPARRTRESPAQSRISPFARVAFTYDIDVLAAVPVERIAYPRFDERQWPRILEGLERRRAKFVAVQARRSVLKARRKV